MDSQITQAQREQVVQQWRIHAQSRALASAQIEQFVQQILSGAADSQIQQMQSRSQGPQQQPQQQHFGFHTPFGIFDMPTMAPMAPMPSTPPMPMFQPMMPPMPPMPTFQPITAPVIRTPMAPPAMPLMSPPAIISPAVQGIPQVTNQTLHFLGGSANQQNVNFTGRSVNANFSYSSSSTTYNSSNHGVVPQAHHSLTAAPGYQQPRQLDNTPAPPPPYQSPISHQSFVAPQSVPPPSMPLSVPQPAFPARPVAQSMPATHTEPRNPRLANAFSQQLDEETYFSKPPGAPDRSAALSRAVEVLDGALDALENAHDALQSGRRSQARNAAPGPTSRERHSSRGGGWDGWGDHRGAGL